MKPSPPSATAREVDREDRVESVVGGPLEELHDVCDPEDPGVRPEKTGRWVHGFLAKDTGVHPVSSSTPGNFEMALPDSNTLTEKVEQIIKINKRFKKWKLFRKLDDKWKLQIIPYLETYTDMFAGSFYEEKSHSLVWHFRISDKLHGEMVANELTDNLKNVTARMSLHVVKGNNIVEIKNIDIDKGTAVKDFSPESNYDFILSIGDDWTDEDMFKALPHNAYTIKVGMAKSYSKFNLYNYMETRTLIKGVINAK